MKEPRGNYFMCHVDWGIGERFMKLVSQSVLEWCVIAVKYEFCKKRSLAECYLVFIFGLL